ncbi:MAG TPA: hypothetical protein VHK90_11095, partial [Thermoanaerobaculia bacterium]|nr:hypothetical protein [Thermoanaerobaculia bacterium]
RSGRRSTSTCMKILLALAVAFPLFAADPPVELRNELREYMLALVNGDRAKHGLAPVELEKGAAWFADQFCEEQLATGTTGHFNLKGESPYLRWSALNYRTDLVNENASAWSTSRELTPHAIKDMIRRSQQSMMSEKPPFDGHRRVILDPWATHLAPGFAWKGGELRFSQVFLRRYVSLEPLPKAVWKGDRVTITGWLQKEGDVDAVTVHYEPLPRPLTAAEASAIPSYALPKRRRHYLPRLPVTRKYMDGSRGDIVLENQGQKSFTLTIDFTEGPGIYTIVTWVRPPGAGPIEVTNHSIRVEESPAAETLQVIR